MQIEEMLKAAFPHAEVNDFKKKEVLLQKITARVNVVY